MARRSSPSALRADGSTRATLLSCSVSPGTPACDSGSQTGTINPGDLVYMRQRVVNLRRTLRPLRLASHRRPVGTAQIDERYVNRK